jgi:hypothetical protein
MKFAYENLQQIVHLGFWAIIPILVFANNASAGTLYVPNNYLTIQEAIDASNPGDTIIVASGVYRLYSGNITIVK